MTFTSRNGEFLGSKIAFLHFSPTLFWLFQRYLVGTLVGVRSTLSADLTSNDIDLGKCRPFQGSEITFLYFSSNLFWLFQRILIGKLLGVRSTLSANLTSNDLDLGKWRPFSRSKIAFLHFSPNPYFGYFNETWWGH